MAERRQNSRSAYDGNAARNIGSAAPAPERKRKLSTREKSNLVRLNEEQIRQARRSGINPAKTVMSVFAVLVGFVLLASVINSEVQLTELTEQINSATTNLEQLQSVQIQLEMEATSNMDASEIEEYAKNTLGMEKVNNDQITYVNLARQDNGVVVDAGGDKNIFEKIFDTIGSWLS